jgi:hypothetical protein
VVSIRTPRPAGKTGMTDQNIHPSTNIDPVLIEVMRHQLVSVSEEMNITMGQTARSLAAKEGGDFSAALLDRKAT